MSYTPSKEVFAEEEITLDTGAAFTDSTADLLPANAIIDAVPYLITEDITGPPTTITIQTPITGNRFAGPTGGSLAAGAGGVGLQQQGIPGADGMIQLVAGKIRISLDDVPTGGKVLVQVFARVYAVPSV